jgi:hypothetical protein
VKFLSSILNKSSFKTNFSLSVLAAGVMSLLSAPAFARDLAPLQAQPTPYCRASEQVVTQKENFRKAALQGDPTAQQQYQAALAQDAESLRQCRSQTWPAVQAIWLRLHPCDIKAGVLDDLMDRIANKGYNRIYVEVFYDGQVLLPGTNNPTVWTPVVRSGEDLLAQAIQKGHERGLKVYAWLFSMNFGANYAQRPDRQAALARNGRGQTSLDIGLGQDITLSTDLSTLEVDKAFIDPYNIQARQDYQQLVQAVAQRKPDGMLFDYIRYPRQSGSASIVSKVKDLWVYGEASKQTLYQRALNYKGLDLIRRFVEQGTITSKDIAEVNQLYPNEREPKWQNRKSSGSSRTQLLQELWILSAGHAYQGVTDFLNAAVQPAQQQGIAAGAVFFSDSNRSVGRGFDSRMQPWHYFPASLEWHTMAYALCGNTNCIANQVQTVLRQAPQGAQVTPALAGQWGKVMAGNRPTLEAQMDAIHQAAPQINMVSHFSYAWQDPQFEQTRRACSLP